MCVFICVGRLVSLCVHLSIEGSGSEESGRKDCSAGGTAVARRASRPTSLRPLVFSDPKRPGSQRRDGRVGRGEVIQRALGAKA